MPTTNKKPNSDNTLMRYAGLATQFLVGIGLGVYGGMKLDEWRKLSNPMFVWIFPLLIIVVSIYKISKDTNHKK